MGAAPTGMGGPRRSAGFGTPGAPAPPLTAQEHQLQMQQSQEPGNVSSENVPEVQPMQAVAPTAQQVKSTPSLPDLPELPQTSNEGSPEVASIVHGNALRYTRMWYGTEEERASIRDLLREWAEENKADALIFFCADEWYHRPPARLQKLGSKASESEEGA